MQVKNAALQSAECTLQKVEGDGVPTIAEGWIRADGVRLLMDGGVRLQVETLRLRVTFTEAEANKGLAGLDLKPIRDAAVAFLGGRIRMTGRYNVLGGLGVPFSMVAIPEPRAGLNVTLDVRELSVVGLPNPAMVAKAVEERVNAKLAEALDAAALPFPARLEAITVEPGRITVALAGSLDLWRPLPEHPRLGE